MAPTVKSPTEPPLEDPDADYDSAISDVMSEEECTAEEAIEILVRRRQLVQNDIDDWRD